MEISNVVAQLRTTDLASSIRVYTALPGFTLDFATRACVSPDDASAPSGARWNCGLVWPAREGEPRICSSRARMLESLDSSRR